MPRSLRRLKHFFSRMKGTLDAEKFEKVTKFLRSTERLGIRAEDLGS